MRKLVFHLYKNNPSPSTKPNPDKPVIIQCRSGKRSAAAVMQLEQLHGFDNLHNLKGGILAWQEAFDPNMQVY
ncbi:MAG: rhodanese-like domain-containing protein [Sphingobacteriaceae bacterium]|nr:rhodanese-like domain-containing protein [Sphingobacteriaceae bacterium]